MNLVLKPNQKLFDAGDPSDGMYIVRRGGLIVYLKNLDQEVILTKVDAGSIVGEMALFDQLPRSASVKAINADTELTRISQDDFTKLLKQIPKWFVTLMTSLSSRLRQTNDRLKGIESSSKTSDHSVFHEISKIFILTELIWAKEGVKEGKDSLLSLERLKNYLINQLGESENTVEKFIEFLFSEKIWAYKSESSKNQLILVQKALFRNISEYLIQNFVAKKIKTIPKDFSNLLVCFEKASQASSYEKLTVELTDIQKTSKELQFEIMDIKSCIEFVGKACPEIKVVKTSSGLGFHIEKESFQAQVKVLHFISKCFSLLS